VTRLSRSTLTNERYKHLVGKKILLPLTERLIPVIADSYVDPAFGSARSRSPPRTISTTFDVGARHSLPVLNVVHARAALNDSVPTAYQGLDRFEARKRVIADLEAAGLIEKIEKHPLSCRAASAPTPVLEPYLTDQWYVKDCAARSACHWLRWRKAAHGSYPENWTKTYYEWMRNIKDWCVSRQIWWGHRIPAWYDPQGNVYGRPQ